MQPLADIVKLMFKEELRPKAADTVLFYAAPVICATAAFAAFAVVPFGADTTLFGLLERPIHLAAAEAAFWAAPDFPPFMPAPVRDVLGPVAARFLGKYRGQLRLFEQQHEVAPGITVTRTGGHTPGHSVVRLASGDERMTFLGDSVFQNHFDRPDWYNAFDHDPEEAVRVRTRLLRELAASRELLVAAHVSFPFGHVAVAGDAFRFIPAYWGY
jgi:glyoxylase-like metal-dependent hydrolase (beta-lactamase superfamily II)